MLTTTRRRTSATRCPRALAAGRDRRLPPAPDIATHKALHPRFTPPRVLLVLGVSAKQPGTGGRPQSNRRLVIRRPTFRCTGPGAAGSVWFQWQRHWRLLPASELCVGNDRMIAHGPAHTFTGLIAALILMPGCSESPDALVKSAASKCRQGDYRGAITDSSEAIRQNPLLDEAFVWRGIARARINDPAAAISDLDEAIRLNPRSYVAYCNRSAVWQQKGDYTKAVADASEAIRQNPQDAEAYYNRGSSRGRLGEYAGSVADLTEAIRLRPSDPEYYCNRGISLAREGEYEQAILDFTEAIRLRPRYAKAYFWRSAVREKTGDRTGASSDSNEVVHLDPQAYGSRARGALSFGSLVGTNSQPDGAVNRSQPVRSETNRVSTTAGSGG